MNQTSIRSRPRRPLKEFEPEDVEYRYINLTTGEEIEIDEEKELSIVVDVQRSETDL